MSLWWCVRCQRQFPLVAMAFANPTIETDNEALCLLTEPIHVCRPCALRDQNFMIANKPATWRRRAL